ncbi:MAG: ATP-binding protein [Myxococcota bacterium]
MSNDVSSDRKGQPLRAWLDALAEGVLVFDATGAVVDANHAAAELLGVTRAELLGPTSPVRTWTNLRADLTELPAEERPSAVALRTRRPVFRRELKLRSPAGAVHEVAVTAVPQLDAAGEVERVIASFIDLSRDGSVVGELRVFERFFELSPDLLVVADPDFLVLQVNPAARPTLGWDEAALLGRGLLERVHPDDLPLVKETLAGATAPVEFHARLRAREAGWRQFAWVLTPTLTSHLGATFFARLHDVTERTAELEEVRRARQLLDEAFELAELAVLERNPATGTTHATRRLVELLQLPPDAADTISLEHYVLPEELERYRQFRTRATMQERLPPHALRMKTARGELREVRLWVRTTRDEQGVVNRELTVVQDVTQQSVLQAQLRLAERLTSLGTMAAGVAHEINNPLAFVTANLNVVKGELARIQQAPEGIDLVDLRAAVDEALEGADRVRQIVQGLKPFSRVDDRQRGLCDVARLVQASLNMARNELRHRARVVSDLREVSPVVGNEARLGQVFLNLLVNAAHAIPDGHAADHLVTVTTREDNGFVFITVSDTGTGIPPDVLPRIFDPFFSTKRIGEGTGLGLFISQGIVQELGGAISVNSTPGAGSTFEVRLPAAPAGYIGTGTTPIPARRRARLLIVDDEPSILRSLERLLGKQHELTLARSGREALSLIHAGLKYDLILCDLMMPEISGVDLWEQLTTEQQQQVVFMTGGTFTERTERFLNDVNPPLLDKPFTATTLEGLLQRVSKTPVPARPPGGQSR